MTTHDLSLVRGDTLSFDLQLPEIDDSSVTSIFFSVKHKGTDEDYILQKSLDNGIELVDEHVWRVRVAPEDTANAPAGKHVYDLQLGISDDIETILMGSFRLIQDVTVMHYDG